MALPGWMQDIIEKYASGIAHAFLLTGNIQDYPAGVAGANVRNYLIVELLKYVSQISGKRDVIVYWDRRAGFLFPDEQGMAPSTETRAAARPSRAPSMFQKFVEATGLAAPLPPTASGGRAADLNAAAGVSSETAQRKLLEQQGRLPLSALPLLDKLLHYTPAPRTEPGSSRGLAGEQARESLPPPPFRVAVILGYGESLAPSHDTNSEADRTSFVTLSEWARELDLGERGHILLMLVDDLMSLDERLRQSGSRWEQEDLPFPDAGQREAFVKQLIAASEREAATLASQAGAAQGKSAAPAVEPLRLAEGVTPLAVAHWTGGLRLVDVHDITLRARRLRQPLSRALVMERKHAIVSSEYSGVLTLVEGTRGFDSIGGMEQVKTFFKEDVIDPLLQGGEHLRRVPSGILLIGPSGTGKSTLAQAVAHEAGILFVDFQPGKLRDKFVGNSEKRLEKALQGLQVFSPCIVFIDEVDQALRRGTGAEGDSGIGNYFFERIGTMMADPRWRGRVVWLAATNEPDLLDAALLRPGRFSKKLPILTPDLGERIAILEKRVRLAFAGLADLAWPEPSVYEELAAEMEGYTSAEIVEVVDKAYNLYGSRRASSLTEAVREAHQLIIPTTPDIARMTERALYHCSDLDLVPEQFREQVRAIRLRRVKSGAQGEQAGDEEFVSSRLRRN